MIGCTSQQDQAPTALLDPERVVLNETDLDYGYYLALPPQSKMIKGALLILPGFGQIAETVFLDTKLPKYAKEAGILTIVYAGRNRMVLDSFLLNQVNQVLQDVQTRFELESDHLAVGGFSAGGTIALRLAQKMLASPATFNFQPKALFMVDAPIDIFHSWEAHQWNREKAYSGISVKEADWVERYYRSVFGGTPDELPDVFQEVSPFSIRDSIGHEQWLKALPVRSYHDVDIAWRIVNRNQVPRFANFIPNAELINRLQLLGNEQATFMQSLETGVRRDGKRHPHSWSIVDAKECIEWVNKHVE